MKSPFAGMDPYLETRWRDVQSALVLYCREALVDGLPNDLVSRVEDRVYV